MNDLRKAGSEEGILCSRFRRSGRGRELKQAVSHASPKDEMAGSIDPTSPHDHPERKRIVETEAR